MKLLPVLILIIFAEHSQTVTYFCIDDDDDVYIKYFVKKYVRVISFISGKFLTIFLKVPRICYEKLSSDT